MIFRRYILKKINNDRESNLCIAAGHVLTVTSSTCTLLCLTLDNLLRVVNKELAERRPLRPLQRVEQLLDLGGHSAVDRHAWTKTHTLSVTRAWRGAGGARSPTHALSILTQKHLYLITAGTSTQEPGSKSAAGKD